MAKAPTTSKSLDSDVAKELEKALDRDLVSEGDDLDIAASMEDLEAQISRAAEELSRETHNAQAAQQAPDAQAPQDGEFLIEAEVKPASSLGLRPADPPTVSFAPANDDTVRESRLVLQNLNRRSSSGIYWAVALLSLLWIAGGLMLGYLLVGPEIIEEFTARTVLDQPLVLLVAIITLTPLILF